MFILYAIPIGMVAGWLLGGRIDHLTGLRLRWAPVAVLGLVVQVAIFTDPIGSRLGDAGPAVYVASTVAVFAAVLRNVDIPGVAIIAVGAGCNLAAIVANGGWMPADPGALASVGGGADGPSNSIVVADPALAPLTDLFALPAWLPFANVFSIGDVLLAVGIAATIAMAMRRPLMEPAGAAGSPGSGPSGGG